MCQLWDTLPMCHSRAMDADAIVVGAGLAGLVATAELADAGKKVLLLDQEPEQSLGGQAFWSLGGLFLVDSPEQRRMGIKDSYDLALQDWMGSAQFDRDCDHWPRRWAEAYVGFAAGEKRRWLHDQGLRFFPVVGWAERGDGRAGGHGNSVPRFHLTWGTGPGVVAPFERRVREAVARGAVRLCFRHRVDDLVKTAGAVTGVRGALLAPDDVERGKASNREEVGDFEYAAQAVIVTSGGHRRQPRAGAQAVARGATGASPRSSWWPVCRRTWTVGCRHSPRLPAARSSTPTGCGTTPRDCATGTRSGRTTGSGSCPGRRRCGCPRPVSGSPRRTCPGFDTLGTLGAILRTGYEYSWFVLTQKVIEKEFALSGSEQNPDLTGKDVKLLLSRVRPGAPGPVEAFKQHGADFVVADSVEELAAGMNRVAGSSLISADRLRQVVTERDRELDNPLLQGHPGHLPARAPRLPRRQAGPGRGSAQVLRPEERAADRRTAEHPHPQDPRRPAHRSRRAGAAALRRAVAGRVRRRRGRRFRWRRRARVQRLGGHLPRRLHLLRPGRRPGRRRRDRLTC